MRHPARTAAAAALGLSLLLAACGDDDSPTTAADQTTVVDSSSTTTAAGSSTTAAAGATVDANTATVQELTAAFEAAGISNAARWANEVEEYRPYDTSDPDLTHLRDELAKYNPAPETIDAIIAALHV